MNDDLDDAIKEWSARPHFKSIMEEVPARVAANKQAGYPYFHDDPMKSCKEPLRCFQRGYCRNAWSRSPNSASKSDSTGRRSTVTQQSSTDGNLNDDVDVEDLLPS